jgi:hypothetical protein
MSTRLFKFKHMFIKKSVGVKTALAGAETHGTEGQGKE